MKTVLFALLSPVLAGASAEADRVIVTVNGAPLRQSEVFGRLWQRHGPGMLDQMIDELLLRQEARSRGVKAEPGEINERLDRIRDSFPDAKTFEAQLSRDNSSISDLRSQIEEALIREKLIASQKKLSVHEAETKKFFSEHRAKLGIPAGVRLRHIQVKTKAEADALAKQLRTGADFSALAREKSLAPTGKISGGDYGFVTKGMLPPDIEKTAFALAPGDLRVITSPRGAHLLQVVEKRAATAAQYADVKNRIRELILQEKIRKVLPEYLQTLREKASIVPAG